MRLRRCSIAATLRLEGLDAVLARDRQRGAAGNAKLGRGVRTRHVPLRAGQPLQALRSPLGGLEADVAVLRADAPPHRPPGLPGDPPEGDVEWLDRWPAGGEPHDDRSEERAAAHAA